MGIEISIVRLKSGWSLGHNKLSQFAGCVEDVLELSKLVSLELGTLLGDVYPKAAMSAY